MSHAEASMPIKNHGDTKWFQVSRRSARNAVLAFHDRRCCSRSPVASACRRLRQSSTNQCLRVHTRLRRRPATARFIRPCIQYHALFETGGRARSAIRWLFSSTNEPTQARRSNSSANKNGDLKFRYSPNRVWRAHHKKSRFGASSSNDFAGKGEAASANNFSGTITVTVIDVLPNGYLVVSGEKQLAMTQGTGVHPFFRRGAPETVINNTISSIQVADARIEYKANGYIDEAQTMGWLSRFFLTVSRRSEVRTGGESMRIPAFNRNHCSGLVRLLLHMGGLMALP